MSNVNHSKQPPIHKSQIVMVLVLAGISTLFLGLTAAYLYTRFQTDEVIPYPPVAFYVTIALLFVATRSIVRAKALLDSGKSYRVMLLLAICFMLTAIFGVFQVLGWIAFFRGDMAIQKSNALAFLFALSALHHAHVVVGLPFLGYFMLRFRKESQIGLALNEANKHYLRNLSLYWRYVDLLWILLVGMLLASALLS